MRQVGMVFAELERKTGAIRTKEGIRGKVALGQVFKRISKNGNLKDEN